MHEAQDSVHIQTCTHTHVHTHRRVHMCRNSYIKMITDGYQLWLRVHDPGPHYWAGSLRSFSRKHCEINLLESLEQVPLISGLAFCRVLMPGFQGQPQTDPKGLFSQGNDGL